MDNTVGSRQWNLIIGTLLGDGCLERNGRYCRLVIDHSTRQEPYVRWKASRLQTLRPHIRIKQRRDERTNKVYEHCVLRTGSLALLEDFFHLFYREGKKIVPKNLVSIINAEILAVWIMDDGYKRNDCNALRLNTQSFCKSEQELMQNALQALGVTSNIQHHKDSYTLYVPSRAMSALRSIVSPYILPEMAYKIA